MRRDYGVYLVTDQGLCLGRGLLEVVAEAVRGGASMVQLREKKCDTRDFVALARRLKALLGPLGVPLLINDRVDVALAAGADGVHVGQSDMHPADVRGLIGPEAIVGLSVECMEHVLQADALGVDYLGVGPVYATATKPDHSEPWGLEGLRRVRAASRLPMVAIGSVNAENAAQVMETGMDGLAVVSAICSAPSPEQAAGALRDIVNNALRAR
ncbi:thiamine phosphate synthase [Paucidesulfovibrio longus]|uniref:thiamine phosphate synthase n=1 Tax=Paucidesulfovibrio longus TaxID=889 RepID=UPI0003B33C4A|nr:thiamine phosphate synthase [Paucidesulfovibrio longus]